MKKTKILSMLFVMLLLVSICNVPVVNAASKAKFSYVKVNKSKTYYGKTDIKAKVYFKKVVLKGNSDAIKKINKRINKVCNQFLNSDNAKSLHSIAKETAEYGYCDLDKATFNYYADSKVTYNKKGVISIRITAHWFAGGVGNSFREGLTFKLKTGKKLTLKDVTKQSSKTIKNTLIKKAKNQDPGADVSVIRKTKLKKFDFYLKPNNKAMVCFGPYELGWGGWFREFKIKSKYK